ncbi:MAG: hypothetical protein K0R05_1220 [Anaerocolumna sp.]|jgi:hypothetical protein|nr:hypothetical protein [Anaerocolumna sp.]
MFLENKWSKSGKEVIMSYVAPAIKDRFESLPIELKDSILKRNVTLNNIQDLIQILEQIVAEGERA